MNLEIAPVAHSAWFFQAVEQNRQANHEANHHEANYMREVAQAPGSIAQRERLCVMFSQNCRHGPKEQSERDNPKAKAKYNVVEGLEIKNAVHFLKHHERIVDV